MTSETREAASGPIEKRALADSEKRPPSQARIDAARASQAKQTASKSQPRR